MFSWLWLSCQLQLSYISKMSVRLYVCMWNSPDPSFYGIALILHTVLSAITGTVLVTKKNGSPKKPLHQQGALEKGSFNGNSETLIKSKVKKTTLHTR